MTGKKYHGMVLFKQARLEVASRPKSTLGSAACCYQIPRPKYLIPRRYIP